MGGQGKYPCLTASSVCCVVIKEDQSKGPWLPALLIASSILFFKTIKETKAGNIMTLYQTLV